MDAFFAILECILVFFVLMWAIIMLDRGDDK